MIKKLTLLALTLVFSMPFTAFAQMGVEANFGKSKVLWEDVPKNYYRSEHFDIYHSMDLTDESQKKHFLEVVNHLEASYAFLSKKFDHELKERVPVISYRTHSLFEANYIEPDFMPEGVGAFAEPMRNRLVIKADFLPPLNRTIITHELTHIFQFSLMKLNIFSLMRNSEGRPAWFIEGGADWAANSFSPYTRDDIRRLTQRGAAANPEKDLPTWLDLEHGEGNPYTMGAMVFEFLEAKLGDKVWQFNKTGLKERSRPLIDIVEELTEGQINSPEKFDQMHRDYWANKYAKEMRERPRPYQETENFKGRSIVPKGFPMVSGVPSPDGTEMASFSIQKNGLALIVTPIPVEKPYVKKKKRRVLFFSLNQEVENNKPRNLTKSYPPIPWEYPVVQLLDTWPFNGFDLDWWQDPSWTVKFRDARNELDNYKDEFLKLKENREKDRTKAKERAKQIVALEEKIKSESKIIEDLNKMPNVSKIAFFARKGRDHKLFMIDARMGKILNEVDIPLDQAFSPAFSPDGKKIYFSAAKNVTRSIYEVNLETSRVSQVTTAGNFDTAPAVSPDGRLMVYVSFVGDFQKLFILDLNTGDHKQITKGRWNENSPSFSRDGKTILYTSDRDSGVWNLYTQSFEGKINQLTNFFGGVFTPKFAPGSTDKVYLTAYWQYDQFRNFIYPNFELYELNLKKPITEDLDDGDHAATTPDYMKYAFRKENLFPTGLDENQVLNPEKQPNRWKLSGRSAYGGYSTYYGMYTYTAMTITNLLQDKNHFVRFATSGDFRLADYSYVDMSKRLNWGFTAYDQKLPMYYLYYDIIKQNPNQVVINYAWTEQMGADIVGAYPIDKFNRFESRIRLKKKTFLLGVDSQTIQDFPEYFMSTDLGLARLFEDANGTSVSLLGAYVRDTVLYSQNTEGPYVGNALRAQFEYAPPLGGKLLSYSSALVDARKYLPLSRGSLLALRGTGLWGTDRSGDFMLMGGTDIIRGYPYGGLVGNQAFYGSAELRFPLVDAVIFAPGIPVGPIRGFLFGDYGVARFTKEDFPLQKGISYGAGLEFNFIMPMKFTLSKRNLDGYDAWKYDFYVKFNW